MSKCIRAIVTGSLLLWACAPKYLPQKSLDSTEDLLKKAADAVVFIVSNRVDYSLHNYSEFSKMNMESCWRSIPELLREILNGCHLLRS
jgi:hypothetical protein